MRSRIWILIIFFLIPGCVTVQLFSGLEESDANLVVAALESSGIEVTKESGRDGVTLLVPKQDFARAVSLLEAQGLPPKKYDTLGSVFEKSGFVSSRLEEQARYIYALSEELGQTISGIDAVLTARVHIVMPQKDVLGRTEQESSASVFVKYTSGADIDQYKPYIRQLVSNAITGLKFDHVSVISIASNSRSAATGMEPSDVMRSKMEKSQDADPTGIRVIRTISILLICISIFGTLAWLTLPRVRTEFARFTRNPRHQLESPDAIDT